MYQKIFIPIVKGFISQESSSFENKWLRYPKIATNSKKGNGTIRTFALIYEHSKRQMNLGLSKVHFLQTF